MVYLGHINAFSAWQPIHAPVISDTGPLTVLEVKYRWLTVYWNQRVPKVEQDYNDPHDICSFRTPPPKNQQSAKRVVLLPQIFFVWKTSFVCNGIYNIRPLHSRGPCRCLLMNKCTPFSKFNLSVSQVLSTSFSVPFSVFRLRNISDPR